MVMINRLLIILIKAALWILDNDHRNKNEISANDVKKFTHIQEHNFKSDFGTVHRAFRTVPYEVWELKTSTKTLYAADKHRVIREDHSCAWMMDLVPGDRIKTSDGVEEVVASRSLNIRTHMYCVEVNTDDPNDKMNHLYYTDGILSHNTTCAAAYLLWRAMFVKDTTILVVANKLSQALEIMDRIKYAYKNVPDYIRCGVTEYNKGTIVFDNNSKITCRATSADAGRGLSITLLYMDEFAFVPPNKQTEFFTAIQPTLSTGGSCIITSTPKSDEDMFAQIWKGAINNTDEYGNINDGGVGKNGFYPVCIPWWEHPERDEDWARPYREQLGEARFRQEFCCEFISDDETLVSSLCLSRLDYREPEFYTGTVRWYKEPEPGKVYMVSLDPSLGTGGDNAAIQVFEMPGMVQVAEWQHNTTPVRDQVLTLMRILMFIESELHHIGDFEPEIYWTIENNSIGEAVLLVIEDTGIERFPGIMVNEKKRRGQTRRVRKGLNTTNKKKLSSCARLKSLVESDRMKINSRQLLRELKNYVRKESSFSAKPGEHDDLVSATLLIVRMLESISNQIDMQEMLEHISDDEVFDSDPMPFLV